MSDIQKDSLHRGIERLNRRAFLKTAVLATTSMVLAACGAAEAPSTGQTGEGTAQAQAPSGGTSAPATTSKVQIRLSYPDELGKKPKYVEAAAAEFNKQHPEAEVVIDHQKVDSASFYTKLLLAFGAGDAPDIIHIGGNNMAELADANFIAPLTKFVEAWEDWQYYPDAIKAGATYKNEVWALPYGLDTRFLYYRKDVFQQAGLNAEWQPSKVQDIVDAAKAVQAKAPNVIPYVLYGGAAGAGGTTSHAFLPLLWAYGGELMDKDGKWVGSSPALLKTLQYYQQVFLTDKLVPAEVLTLPKPWTTMREKLGAGELALLFEGGWVRGGWVSNSSEEQVAQSVGTVLFPYDDGSGVFTVGGLGTCWYVSNQSEHKDLAWDFIRIWNNKETVAKLNLEDPHPVARTDAAELPEFKQNTYLVQATESLKHAKFEPISSAYAQVQNSIQQVTGRVATGEVSPEDAMQQFAEELRLAVGADNVVTQS